MLDCSWMYDGSCSWLANSKDFQPLKSPPSSPEVHCSERASAARVWRNDSQFLLMTRMAGYSVLVVEFAGWCCVCLDTVAAKQTGFDINFLTVRWDWYIFLFYLYKWQCLKKRWYLSRMLNICLVLVFVFNWNWLKNILTICIHWSAVVIFS